MTRRTRLAMYVAAGLAIFASVVAAFVFRDLRETFAPREQRFLDQRPLAEDVAIELTRRALEDKGFHAKVLTPVHRADGTVFATAASRGNEGYVQWRISDSDHRLVHAYLVRIEKLEGEYRCYAFRSK